MLCLWLGVVLMLKMHYIGIRKLLIAGSALGQYYLGILYFEGWNGEKPDKKRGLAWLYKAANSCEPWAMFYIGNCYRRGDGVEKNIDEAIHWYKKQLNMATKMHPMF